MLKSKIQGRQTLSENRKLTQPTLGGLSFTPSFYVPRLKPQPPFYILD